MVYSLYASICVRISSESTQAERLSYLHIIEVSARYTLRKWESRLELLTFSSVHEVSAIYGKLTLSIGDSGLYWC
jgi:hypothetical protein